MSPIITFIKLRNKRYLRIEASVIEWKIVVIALIHEEQQSSSPPTMGFRDSCRREYNKKRVKCHEVQYESLKVVFIVN